MKEDAEVSRPLLMKPAAVGITGGQGIKQEDHSGGKHEFQLEVAQSRDHLDSCTGDVMLGEEV